MALKDLDKKRAWDKEYAKRPEVLERQREWKRKQRAENRALIHAIKRERGCSRCPETDPICIDFHHVDPTTKKYDMSYIVTRAWPTIEAEMKKCILLCANCHRKEHYGESQDYEERQLDGTAVTHPTS